jgi:outer membrane protein TolC
MFKKIVYLIGLVCFISSTSMAAESARILPMTEFIQQVSEKDSQFEAILLDELIAQYQAKLGLTAADLLLSLKGQYNLNLSEGDENNSEGNVGLSKLFPGIGTEIGVSYGLSTDNALNEPYSQFAINVSQPLARNAFGHANRLAEKITGVEIELAEHQMVEAYEDYLAQSMKMYYSWYAAQMHVNTSEATFRENQKLLENVRARKRSRIADQTDVNKIHLQVLGKESTLIILKKTLFDLTLEIRQAIGEDVVTTLQSAEPETYPSLEKTFAQAYAAFIELSRTQRILGVLEKRSELEVARYADQLLPSADVLLGYAAAGTDQSFAGRENEVYAGLEVEIPFLNNTDQWKAAQAKIKQKKTKIENVDMLKRFGTDLEILYTEIQSTQRQLEIAKQKVDVSEAIVKSENKYYLQGRAGLNDLILAANNLEENRYQHTYLTMQYNILMIEWLRMTDQLVQRKDIRSLSDE